MTIGVEREMQPGRSDAIVQKFVKHFRFIAIVIAVLTGFGFATLVGVAAWDHNPEGEFHDWDTGAVHWDAFCPLLAMAFFSPVICVVVANILVQLIKKFGRK